MSLSDLMVVLRLRPLGNELAFPVSSSSAAVGVRRLLPDVVAVLRTGALGGNGGFTEALRSKFLSLGSSLYSLPRHSVSEMGNPKIQKF